jgi:hypothetical protein
MKLILILVVFGPIAILSLGFLFLVYKLIMKSKNFSWKGTVVDKIYREGEDDDGHTTHFFTLVVETEGGAKKNVGVSQKLYDQFEKGDKIQKPKGKLFPEKI